MALVLENPVVGCWLGTVHSPKAHPTPMLDGASTPTSTRTLPTYLEWQRTLSLSQSIFVPSLDVYRSRKTTSTRIQAAEMCFLLRVPQNIESVNYEEKKTWNLPVNFHSPNWHLHHISLQFNRSDHTFDSCCTKWNEMNHGSDRRDVNWNQWEDYQTSSSR